MKCACQFEAAYYLKWLKLVYYRLITLEFAKHILLECEPADIRRRRIFEGKPLGEEADANLVYKFLEHVQLTGVGKR